MSTMNRLGVALVLLTSICTARAQLRIGPLSPGPLRPGDLAMIAWDRDDAVDSVRFSYSLDGAAWFPVTLEAGGAGHVWRVPAGLSGACMVRAEGVIPASVHHVIPADSSHEKRNVGMYETWARLNGDGSRCMVYMMTDHQRRLMQLQLWDAEASRLLSTQTTTGYNPHNIDAIWDNEMFMTCMPEQVWLDSGGPRRWLKSWDMLRLWSMNDGRLLVAMDSVSGYVEIDPAATSCRGRTLGRKLFAWHRDAGTGAWSAGEPERATAEGEPRAREARGARVAAWFDSLAARHGESLLCVAPDSSRALVPDEKSGGATLLAAGSFAPIAHVRPAKGYSTYEYQFSPDGAFAIVRLRYGLLVLLDAKTGKQLARLTCPWNSNDVAKYCVDCCSNYYESIVWDPSGRHLIVAPSFAGTSRMHPLLFDLRTGRRIRLLCGVQDLAFSSGGTFIRGTSYLDEEDDAESEESSEHLFEARTGRRVARLGAILRQYERCDKAPGDTIAYIAGNRLVIWDVEAGRRLVSLEHPAPIESAYYLSDSRTCTLDTSGALRLWDTEHGALVRLLSTHVRPRRRWETNEYYGVNAAAGYIFANRRGPGRDGVTIWDARSGRPLTPEARPLPGDGPSFSGDGTTVAMYRQYGAMHVDIYRLPYADTATVVADTVAVVIAPAAAITPVAEVVPDAAAPLSGVIDSVVASASLADRARAAEDTGAPVSKSVASPASELAMTCSPNPVSDVLTVVIDAASACGVRLSLSDMRGVQIGGLTDRSVPQGAHVVRFDVGALPAGVYLVTAEGECGRCVRSVTVVR